MWVIMGRGGNRGGCCVGERVHVRAESDTRCEIGTSILLFPLIPDRRRKIAR